MRKDTTINLWPLYTCTKSCILTCKQLHRHGNTYTNHSHTHIHKHICAHTQQLHQPINKPSWKQPSGKPIERRNYACPNDEILPIRKINELYLYSTKWMSLKKIESFLKKMAKINSVWINLQNTKLKFCVVSRCLHRQNDSHCHRSCRLEVTGEDGGEQALSGIVSAASIVSLHN